MSERAAEQFTPIDRPLMRSDLNDIKLIVESISDRQIEFLDRLTAFEHREREMARRQHNTDAEVAALKRNQWAPVFACTVILLLTLAAGLLR